LSYLIKIFWEVKLLPEWFRYNFSTNKKAIYVGCTNMGNLGDEAILEATKKMLPSLAFYSVNYRKQSYGSLLRKLMFKTPDFIVLGGGTLIRKKRDESYLRILLKLNNQWPKAKLIILGPGVSNPVFAKMIGFPIDIEGWSSLLKKAYFISVRGEDSRNEMLSWNLNKDINVLHDPAIFFFKEKLSIKLKTKKIGLNFADIGDRIYGGNTDVIKKFALEFVDILSNSGWTIYLYPSTKSDLNYMLNDIGLSANKNIRVYKDYKNLTNALRFLSSLDIFVGQRLHSVIFSGCASTPFYALEYEPKTRDFLSSLKGFNSYYSRVDNLNATLISNRINEMYSNIDLEQNKLHYAMQTAKNEQLGIVEKLNSML
jgi:polysaccharide pyruvyl transferase WcaK-like protein